ncbi:MAG: SurA N-terminal domain-containing protein [Nitrospiraceae bacterium]|nr:MAG: SurA N-terminal domain-containing protein [Nitrospiraceae bacterium]
MKNYTTILVFSIVILVFLSGCSKPPIIVNGKEIDGKTYEFRLNERVEAHKQMKLGVDMSRIKQAVIQELIGETLILEEAAGRDIQVSDEELDKQITSMRKSAGKEEFDSRLKERGIAFDQFKTMTKEKMIISKFINTLVNEDAVQEHEIREYYSNSPKPFIKPIRVFMRLVEFPNEEAALAALDIMKNNKISFDQMADELREEKKAFSTDYGWVNPAVFSRSISSAIKGLDVGTHGGPYMGKNSYFLIRVKDREKETVARFEEVKDDINTLLLQQKRQAAIAHWVADRKKMAKIEINL